MPRGTRSRSSRTGAERVDHLDLVDDVEVAAPLPEQQVDVGERLEPAAELRRGLAHALGHRAHLAVALGQEHDDAVGLAQAVGAQDDALVAEEAHGGRACGAVVRAGRRAGRRRGGRGRAGSSARRAGRLRRGPACVGGQVGRPVVRLLGRAVALAGRGVVRSRP